jgi:hypothetical protein
MTSKELILQEMAAVPEPILDFGRGPGLFTLFESKATSSLSNGYDYFARRGV